MDILDIFLRSFLSVTVLFILAKILGYRQISQLSFFDYIIGISIGSIAAQLAGDQEMEYLAGLIAMVVYAFSSYIITILGIKSIKVRRFFTGAPIILIEYGKILNKNLRKANYDINDLLSESRIAGFFDISNIYMAIMEPTGKISFLPFSSKRPLNACEENIYPPQEGLLANVIIDGHIMKNNLKTINVSQKMLDSHLKNQNIKDIKNIILATYDSNNTLKVYLKNEKEKNKGIFI